jgi:fructose-bisphosphate aldolase class 1
VNAISKNLDKSTDLKKQIDAAILKGEIEKDIKSADTTKKRLDEAQIKRLERDERENTTTAKISKIFQANKGAITAGETASVLREDGISYDDLIPDKEFLKFQKNNPGADEVDFFKSIGGKLEDGRYVVGSRLIEKRDNQIKLVV